MLLSFQLLEKSPEKILSILNSLNPSKAVDIDDLSGKFLKDDAHVLAQPISQLCNLSIKLPPFQEVTKLLKLIHFLKKALRPILKTTAPFRSSPRYQKLLKGLFMTKQRII